MHHFSAKLDIIGINPFVPVPKKVLHALFKAAGKEKGHIAICGTVNGKPYEQSLVRYQGQWRLYINAIMLPNSPKRIGETIQVSVDFDPHDRTLQPHPGLVKALSENEKATTVFENLPPSLKKEIIRYISSLKTDESREKNIKRAINFLLGKENFIGRKKP